MFVEDEREDSHGDAAADGADTVSSSDEDGASVDTTRNDTLCHRCCAIIDLYKMTQLISDCMYVYVFLLLLYSTSERRRARRGV